MQAERRKKLIMDFLGAARTQLALYAYDDAERMSKVRRARWWLSAARAKMAAAPASTRRRWKSGH